MCRSVDERNTITVRGVYTCYCNADGRSKVNTLGLQHSPLQCVNIALDCVVAVWFLQRFSRLGFESVELFDEINQLFNKGFGYSLSCSATTISTGAVNTILHP